MATPPTITGIEPEEVRGDVMRMLPPIERALRATEKCLRQGLTIRDNVDAYIRQVDFTVPDDWRTVPVVATWNGNVGGGNAVFAWRKDDDGHIHTRGRVTWVGPPAAPVNNEPIATVPAGWAPPARVVFYGFATGGVYLLSIDTDGVLRWSNTSTSFTNISVTADAEWDAADRRPDVWADPLILDCEVPWAPAYVHVLSLRYAGERTRQITGAGPVIWREVKQSKPGVRRLEIQRILGLAPTQKYTMTVGVFPE